MNKTFQLIKDVPGTNIKAGNIFTLNSQGLYVDDFGDKFNPQDVEKNAEYFIETVSPQIPPVAPIAPVADQYTPGVPHPLTEPVSKPFDLTQVYEHPQQPPQQQYPPQQSQQPVYWKPEPGDYFFWIKGDGQIMYEMWQNQQRFYLLYELNNVFRYQGEAQQTIEVMKKIYADMRTRFYGGIAPLTSPNYAPTQYAPAQPTQPAYSPYQPAFYPPQQTDPLRAQPDMPAAPPPAFRAPNTTLPYEERK